MTKWLRSLNWRGGSQVKLIPQTPEWNSRHQRSDCFGIPTTVPKSGSQVLEYHAGVVEGVVVAVEEGQCSQPREQKDWEAQHREKDHGGSLFLKH